MRYATVARGRTRTREDDERAVGRALPSSYRVLSSWEQGDSRVVLVAGTDVAGWTMDDYVLPRLATCGWYGSEVDASTGKGLARR